MADVRSSFSGSIPEYYDRHLGPAFNDAFAVDLAQRLPIIPPGDVLEVACGTGLVTNHLRDRLDPTVRLVATDVSKAMVEYASRKLRDHKSIEWREADAVNLPFANGEFGAVVCAFGVMYVPDKLAALREARRVLKDGGILLFNVWDRIEENQHAWTNAQIIEARFPGDEKMRFRTPFEMYDRARLRQLLEDAGFREMRIETVRLPFGPVSARSVATGLIRGTPRSLLLDERGVPLDEVIEKVAAALAKASGDDPYRGQAQAIIVEARANA